MCLFLFSIQFQWLIILNFIKPIASLNWRTEFCVIPVLSVLKPSIKINKINEWKMKSFSYSIETKQATKCWNCHLKMKCLRKFQFSVIYALHSKVSGEPLESYFLSISLNNKWCNFNCRPKWHQNIHIWTYKNLNKLKWLAQCTHKHWL